MHEIKIVQAGKPAQAGRKAMVMIHGRGATAESILSLAEYLDIEDFALWAPQATNYTWYPYSFMMPRAQNQPWLDSALQVLGKVGDELESLGVAAEDIYWLGFSQGACLALEYVASRGRRYGGVFGLSGGLIGQTLDLERYAGRLDGMPVFLGCSDVDAHIPVGRVHESAEVFERMGAAVVKKIYPGMGHEICEDEMAEVRRGMKVDG